MKRFITYLVCVICFTSTSLVFGEIRSLIKEYSYQASELDSKTTCRAIALEQVKRDLLEELGTYVESTTIVQDYQIEKDEIKTLSAGVVQTKVLDEKWDGRDYWLKAQVSADPDEVAASIEKLRNDQKLAEELAESQSEKEAALDEVERLKAELAEANADKEQLAQYNQAVNQIQASDSFEQGSALTVAGDYEGAAKSYDRAIDLRPDDAKAYFNRSVVYIYLGDYPRATRDLDRAMLIRPANTNIYYQRASAYKEIRERRIIEQPQRPSPFARRPYRPVAPKDDPLQRFLNKKQAEHKLVRVNPFAPRPVVKRTGKPLQMQPYQAKDRPATGPDLYRKGDSTPPNRLDGQRSVTPRGPDQQGELRKRDLTPEQRRILQQQQAQDNQKRLLLQQQQRQQLQPKGQPVVKEPQRPEVRKQDRIAPVQVDRSKPVAKPRVEPVKKKTLKEREEEKKNLKKKPADQDDAKTSRH